MACMLLVFLAGFSRVEAFTPTTRFGSLPKAIISGETQVSRTSKSPALFAGFGGGTGSKKKAKGKKKGGNAPTKLKPKQQWDRYSDLKTEEKIRVGIRMKEDESDEWLEVGKIRSKGTEYTAIAVAVQRAIIAEHGKRLYPLQVSNKKTLEWAYFAKELEEWTTVDKSILEAQPPPAEIEKMIGFEGRPDPSSGFYCVYDNGKLKLGDETSFM